MKIVKFEITPFQKTGQFPLNCNQCESTIPYHRWYNNDVLNLPGFRQTAFVCCVLLDQKEKIQCKSLSMVGRWRSLLGYVNTSNGKYSACLVLLMSRLGTRQRLVNRSHVVLVAVSRAERRPA